MSSKPRRFDSLRARAPQPITSGEQEPIEKVIRRLFATGADGPRVMAWLMARADEVTPLNASEAVLRDAEGRRRLVQDIRRIVFGEAD